MFPGSTSHHSGHQEDKTTKHNAYPSPQVSAASTARSNNSAPLPPRQLTPITASSRTQSEVPKLPLGTLSDYKRSISLLPGVVARNNNDQNNDNYDDALISPGLQRALMVASMESFPDTDKTARRNLASDHVLEQAYKRCLSTLEHQARQEDVLNYQSRSGYENWLQQQKKKKEDSVEQMRSYERFLKDQIDEFHQRKSKDKQERRSMKISHELPGTVNSPGGGSTPSSMGNGRSTSASGATRFNNTTENELLQSLEFQIQYNKERKSQSKKKTLEEEREYLEHVAIELDLQSAAERAAHLEKQKTLLEAWEREAHIRNLRKLQRKGSEAVTSYIQSNLEEPFHGVGYDSRKISSKL